jgi:hypothetical protein
MDPTQFDALTRALSGLTEHLPTRRRLVQTLGLSLLGLRAGMTPEAEAKNGRRKRRQKKKRKCLFGQRRCRDRRCHGCCSDADCGGNVCDLGTCSDCPRNQRLCRGGCIAEDACCGDGECGGGRVCIDGVCACGPDRQLCEGVCIANDACCGTDCPIETCTPETCNGCCDGDACREGDGQNFCGRGGVACASCGRGQVCDAGECVCPSGQRQCGDRCIPETDCCTDGDCEPCETCAGGACTGGCLDGEVCDGGTCICASGNLCAGACCGTGQRCGASDSCIDVDCSAGGCEQVTCVPDICADSTCCSGSAVCSGVTTSGLCCAAGLAAFCICESAPGAGDGRIGCCTPGGDCPDTGNTRAVGEPAGPPDGSGQCDAGAVTVIQCVFAEPEA